MRTMSRWAVLPVILLLAACAGDDGTEADVVITDAPEAPAAPMAGTTPPPMGAGMSSTSQVVALQGSGVGGEVTLTDTGDTQTEVMVRLTGTGGGGTHPGHIHAGTCDAVGSVVQPLQPIATDASGAGSMTTSLDVSLMTLLDGQHVVAYHPDGGGPPIACAQLTQHQM